MDKVLTKTKKFAKKINYAFAEYFILLIINKTPCHGYGICGILKKKSNLLYGPSTVYPILKSLFNDGYLTYENTDKKKVKKKTYIITSIGKRLLNRYIKEYEQIIKSLQFWKGGRKKW